MIGMSIVDTKSVRDFGGDGQVIVLLHGFLSSSRYWNRLQPYLTASGYRVIAVDLLGFGRAPRPKYSTYGYREHIAYLDVILKKMKLDKPFTVIGHSMGALLALRYAILSPSRINSLVLLHPPIYKNCNEARYSLKRTSRLYRFLIESRYRRFVWAFIITFSIQNIAMHSRISRERTFENVIEQSEALPDLAKTETKTLLLMGLQDRPEFIANLNTAKLSSTVTVLTKNLSHNSPAAKPSEIQQTIIDFIG